MAKALIYWIGILFTGNLTCWGQHADNRLLPGGDTLPDTVTTPVKQTKIAHTEPLYLIVRDLGARKGEREWNVGTEVRQQAGGTTWQPFVEYEFAPVNRLGLEIEIPFQLTVPATGQEAPTASTFRVHAIKTSVQWTYAVISPWQTSLAVGYTHELFVNAGGVHAGQVVFTAEEGHPFLVAAKKWEQRWNSLVYAALGGKMPRQGAIRSEGYELNLALHYVIPRYKAFVGVELYQHRNGPQRVQAARPQIRVALKNNLFIGLVANVPLAGIGTASSFIRLVYKPRNR